MQIVIDIDDEIAQSIIEGNNYKPRNIVKNFQATIAYAIKYGTPLPKGHGDLVDRNDLLAESYCIDDWCGNEINIVDVMTVKMANAIIEADTESEVSE